MAKDNNFECELVLPQTARRKISSHLFRVSLSPTNQAIHHKVSLELVNTIHQQGWRVRVEGPEIVAVEPKEGTPLQVLEVANLKLRLT